MLIGRDVERRALSDVIAQAVASAGAAVVVRGEPGIGKTALLRDLVNQLGTVTTLTTAGIESERTLAFSALHRLLMPLLTNVDRLPEPQSQALGQAFGSRITNVRVEDRFLIFLGALSLLADAAESSPVVCIVDDAHWLDEPSAEALRFISRRLKGMALGIVFAARVGDVSSFDAPDLPELRLTGLTREDADQIIAFARPGVDEDVREALWRRTDGNPLALLEVPRALTTAQMQHAGALPTHLPVTDHLREVFSGQLRRLPRAARLYLLVVSLDGSGDPGAVHRAAEFLGIDFHGMQVAEHSGLIEAVAGRVQVRHPLVGSAIAASFSETDHRRVHGALADALEHHHDVDRAVWHRAAAATPPDDRVAQDLEAAATRFAARGGHESASLALERAAQLSSSREDAGKRLVGAAGAAWQAADPARTRTLAQHARSIVPAGYLLTDIDRLRAFIEMNFGSPRLAHGMLIGAASEASRATAYDRAAQLAMVASALTTFGFDSGARLPPPLIEQLATAAAQDRPTTASLLRGFTAWAGGWTPEAACELRTAIADRDADPAPDELTNLGIAALQLGDDGATAELHSRQLDAARAQGSPLGVIHALTRRSIMRLASGEWREMEVDCTEVLDLARATGHDNQLAFPLAAMLAVDSFRGVEDVDARAEEIEALLHAHPGGVLDVLARDVLSWARGIRAAAEDLPTALRYFSGIATPLMRLSAALDYADAAHRAQDPEALACIASEMHQFAAATQNGWALDAEALVLAFTASPEDREMLLSARLDDPGETRARIRGRLLLAYGEHLRRTRRRLQARSVLREAHAIFSSLEAAHLRERAASELRASGESVTRATLSNVAAAATLTPQEVQVARAVQRGLSNRDIAADMFLSPRTVEFHLRNIFNKLGLASRAELFRFDLS